MNLPSDLVDFLELHDMNWRAADFVQHNRFKEKDCYYDWTALVIEATSVAKHHRFLETIPNVLPMLPNLRRLAITMDSAMLEQMKFRTDTVEHDMHDVYQLFLPSGLHASLEEVEFRNFFIDRFNSRFHEKTLENVAGGASKIAITSIVDAPIPFDQFPHLRHLAVGLDKHTVAFVNNRLNDIYSADLDDWMAENWENDNAYVQQNQLLSSASCIHKVNYNNLVSLSITTTRITELPDNAFTNNTVLQFLDLSRNAISVLPSSLCNCKQLKTLILRDNCFREFPSNILCELPALEHLDFSNQDTIKEGFRFMYNFNRFGDVYVDYPSFSSLKRFYMKNVHVSSFRVARSVSIERLEKTKGAVAHIGPGSEYFSTNKSLLNAYLFYNILKEMFNNLAFYRRCANTIYVPILQGGGISDTVFNETSAYLLHKHPHADAIVLHGDFESAMRHFDRNGAIVPKFKINFAAFVGLEAVYVRDLFELKVDDSLLALAPTLKILKLQSKITTLPKLSGLTNLQTLALGLKNGASLYLIVNNVNDNTVAFMTSPAVRNRVPWQFVSKLKSFSATFCALSGHTDPTTAISGTTLQHLDLSYNNIDTITGVVGKLPNLKTLALRKNNISVFPVFSMEIVLNQLSSLRRLDLSSYYLEQSASTMGRQHIVLPQRVKLDGAKFPVLERLDISGVSCPNFEFINTFNSLTSILNDPSPIKANISFAKNAFFPRLETLAVSTAISFINPPQFPSLKQYAGPFNLAADVGPDYFIAKSSFLLMDDDTFDEMVYDVIIANRAVLVRFDAAYDVLEHIEWDVTDTTDYTNSRFDLQRYFMFHSNGYKEVSNPEQSLEDSLKNMTLGSPNLGLRNEPYIRKWVQPPDLPPQTCMVCYASTPKNQATMNPPMDNNYFDGNNFTEDPIDDTLMCTCNVLESDVITTYNIQHNIAGTARDAGLTDQELVYTMRGHGEHFLCRGCYRLHLHGLAVEDKPLRCPMVPTWFCNEY